MFKNKTEQNRNDERYNQTGITVKINYNHDCVKLKVMLGEFNEIFIIKQIEKL